MTLEPALLKRRLMLTALVLLAAWLLLGLGQGLCRWALYPRPAGQEIGLLAQRYGDARFQSPPGAAHLERRTRMSDRDDPDFRGHDFALRLTGYLHISLPGPYLLASESDDDSRLYLDGVKIIDNSGRHPMRLRSCWVWLGPGPHLLEVEYAQRDGGAGLNLLMRPPWRAGLVPLDPAGLSPSEQVYSRQQAEYLGARAATAPTPWAALLLWLSALLLARVWLPGQGRQAGLALASLTMVAGLWLCSGTMSLYGATTPQSSLVGPCRYVVNIDHMHFEATYRMLEGQNQDLWGFSLVLRRILYPLVAYPLMRLLGYMEGGFLSNVLLALAALYSWTAFLTRKVGPRGAFWGAWLLATYPGLAYWAGLPYSYAIIVPASLWGFMVLVALGQQDASPRRALLLGLALGGLSLGYDLLPFFAPAALGLVCWRARRPGPLLCCLAGLALPAVLLVATMNALGVPPASQNAQQPLAIVLSYLAPKDWPAWGRLLAQVPQVLVGNFLASNFYVLPLLFLIAVLAGLGRGGWKGLDWQPAELALPLGLLAVFLFNNLAPPHNFGTFRGDFAARFYQPSLAVLLFFLARRLQALPPRSWLAWLCAGAVFCHAWLCLGPVLRLPLASQVYFRFYRHAPDGDYLTRALDNMGRRPLGLCAPGGLTAPPRP
ncbi:MAG: PA14 domain-containing protein [Pseudomonadota bacterium]